MLTDPAHRELYTTFPGYRGLWSSDGTYIVHMYKLLGHAYWSSPQAVIIDLGLIVKQELHGVQTMAIITSMGHNDHTQQFLATKVYGPQMGHTPTLLAS